MTEICPFAQISQPGSHAILKKPRPEDEAGCAIPLQHEMADGTLRGILRQAEITGHEFVHSLLSVCRDTSATLPCHSHGTRNSLTEVTQFEVGRCRAHQSRKSYH